MVGWLPGEVVVAVMTSFIFFVCFAFFGGFPNVRMVASDFRVFWLFGC